MVVGCSLLACASQKSFSVKGTVSEIQRGKDGYTAIINDAHNQPYQAVISRVNMANTTDYQQLQTGDKVTVYGDTVRLDNIISIKVNRIKK